MDLHQKTSVLIEALPYIKKFKEKIVVIKVGGNASSELAGIIEDIVLLKHIGIKPVIVHGGGPEIDQELVKIGIIPKFVNGLRYTDEATMKVVGNVFRKINDEIVGIIKAHEADAADAADAIKSKQKDEQLGLVGEITGIETGRVHKLLRSECIPVISPVGIGANGEIFNINADTAASHVAVALNAEKLTILTNVDGIMIDGKTLPHIDIEHAESEIEKGAINKGMIPKVQACIFAVRNKCPKAHLINGLVPHSLLLEIFTDKGVGTEIVYKNGYEKNY
ncbi:acetylglutamate kinase [Candidatus Woesearchaeota archaeon]|nr:acetylglutamate kinase [Candidatus Woesearchaeota archaeon]